MNLIEDIEEVGINNEEDLDIVIDNLRNTLRSLSKSGDADDIKSIASIAGTLSKVQDLKKAKDDGKSLIESFGLDEAPSKSVIDKKLQKFFTNYKKSRDDSDKRMTESEARSV